jgi:hypothetical protein
VLKWNGRGRLGVLMFASPLLPKAAISTSSPLRNI